MGKINLQMYSFMDGTMNDSRENLKLASEMGYDGVELFGPNLKFQQKNSKLCLQSYIWNRYQCMLQKQIW
jgi:sugar phosphate isomerase/epimerase